MTIIAKLNANQPIYGELFFIYGGGGQDINGIATLTAVELPVPLENAKVNKASILHEINIPTDIILPAPVENTEVNSTPVENAEVNSTTVLPEK